MEDQQIKILDCHHHYGTLVMSAGSDAGRLEAAQLEKDEQATRLGRMSNAGIDAAVIMPVNRYLRPRGAADTVEINNGIARYRDLDKDHFPVALGVTEPLHGEEGLDEIRRVDEELGLFGISYHTRWQGVATDDPWVIRGLEVLQERRMLPFIHAFAESYFETPLMVCHLAEAFPELPIIVTDALSGHAQEMQFLWYAKQFPNLYFDTSCALSVNLIIPRWVSEVGASRLLFGSDTYSAHMVTQNSPELIRACGISEQEANDILRNNLASLLDWTGRKWRSEDRPVA